MTEALTEVVTNLAFFIAQECHAQNDPIQQQKAEFWYQQALRLNPDDPELNYAMSYIATDKGEFEKAIDYCTKAMSSSHAEHAITAHYNRGLCKLMLNDYVGGFVDYDARLNFPLNKSSRIERFGDLPYWKGEPCQILHVSGEQGFGDIFQFSRYVPLITKLFNVDRILFEVPKSLRDFYRHNFRFSHEIQVVSEQWHPKVDYHIQLVSLCKVFGTTYDNVPPIKLEAEPAMIPKWFDRTCKKFKVGFCRSARANDNDLQVMEWNARREIDENLFHHIFAGLDVEPVAITPDLNPDIESWSDTAGLIANMDLIVSIDSGPVHLAAALGVPTLLLNHKKTCWRWQLEGHKTPWYGDNVHIIRQAKEGDWASVIAEAKQYLMAMQQRQAA